MGNKKLPKGGATRVNIMLDSESMSNLDWLEKMSGASRSRVIRWLAEKEVIRRVRQGSKPFRVDTL